MDASSKFLLGSLFVLVTLVALLIVADESRLRLHGKSSSSFQQLVGGLGIGPATDWSRCAHTFDPRVSYECYYDAGPQPGGANLCPYRTIAVLYSIHDPPTIKLTELDEHAGLP